MAFSNFQAPNMPGVGSNRRRSFDMPQGQDYLKSGLGYMDLVKRSWDGMRDITRQMARDGSDETLYLMEGTEPFDARKLGRETASRMMIDRNNNDSLERRDWGRNFTQNAADKMNSYANINNGYFSGMGAATGAFGNVASAFAGALRV